MSSDYRFEELERYRAYLRLLVRTSLDPEWLARIDASDVVQETMLDAYRDYEGFRGSHRAARIEWLRRILANNLADQIRRLSRQKRDAHRERSLQEAVQQSSCQLQNLLAARHNSPSQIAIRNEDLLRLAHVLATLPESQQQAIRLHKLHGQPVAEVARQMERTECAVAGLIRRGLKSLREALVARED